jgi:hypothetical protein
MLKKLIWLSILFSLVGCRSAPFKVEELALKEKLLIQPAERRLINDFEGVLNDSMASRYKKAKKPSFALIKGYYRLPSTKPFGSVTLVRKFSYRTSYEAIETADGGSDYSIEPMPGDDAIALNEVLNALLNIGVTIQEISMSDALNIAQAEAAAAKENKILQAKKILPPKVDYLMSIYRASSSQGPVLIGRVIKKDGTLTAFRVIYLGGASTNQIGGLITSLFEDTIGRI